MEYIEFVVTFEPPGADGYPVAAVDSPAGQARGPVRLRAEAFAHDLPLLGWSVRRSGIATGGKPRDLQAPSAVPDPLRLGAELHRALFAGEIQRLWAATTGVAAARNAGLRLVLRLDLGDPALSDLARLPWELLYDEAQGRFLVDGDRRRLLVRSLSVPEFALEACVKPPLRVLAVLANPADLAPLNLTEEKRRLFEIASHGGIEIDFVEHADPPTLRQRVLASRCHVVHFMGHGQFERGAGEGAILLTGKDGNREVVPGRILARHLCDLGLHLVVLNACRTAEVADGRAPDPFAGVAAALVWEGMTAAVAMQFPISDEAAIRFSKNFYSRLAAGDPVDVAVSEARLAIRTAAPDSLEWATPVAYLRGRSRPVAPPSLSSRLRRLLASMKSRRPAAEGRRTAQRLVVKRVAGFPIGLCLVLSSCVAFQAVAIFFLAALCFNEKFRPLQWPDSILTLLFLPALLVSLEFGRALPPQLWRWTLVIACVLCVGAWSILDIFFPLKPHL